MVLEVCWGREGEFGFLGRAVGVPGAGDAGDDGDVEGEVEGGDGVGGEGLVGVFAVGVGEEDGEGWGVPGDGEVVG